MPKCPKCGTRVEKPTKTWKMAGRPSKSGKRSTLTIPLYKCPKCNKAFRAVLSKKKGYESPLAPPDYESPFEGPYGPRKKRRDTEEDS